MILTQLIGYIAAFLTTIAFLPQVYVTWKTKSTKDISLGMFLLFSTGVCAWLFYGILIRSMPVIIANSITLMLAMTILYFKLKYK